MADLDEATILKAAQEMAALLRGKLDDYDAVSVEIARDETFTMAGGKIDGTLVCNAEGGKMTMKISGTFSDDAFAIDNEMETTMPGGARTMKIKAKTTGKRIGDCPGTQA